MDVITQVRRDVLHSELLSAESLKEAKKKRGLASSHHQRPRSPSHLTVSLLKGSFIYDVRTAGGRKEVTEKQTKLLIFCVNGVIGKKGKG